MKGLVLASVFRECYLCDRKLTVSELLAADPILNDHYGRKPHVLSNVLRRCRKSGLLDHVRDEVKGHSYRYQLTEKGFNRILWMCEEKNRAGYLFCGIDLLKFLWPALLHILEKKKAERVLRDLRSLQKELRSSGHAADYAKIIEIELAAQNTELELNYRSAKNHEILIELREAHARAYEELRFKSAVA